MYPEGSDMESKVGPVRKVVVSSHGTTLWFCHR